MARVIQAVVAIELPVPPSTNRAFAARHGSHMTVRTAAYKFWLAQVFEAYGDGEKLPRLAPGAYGLWIDLPAGMTGDIDNRVKLLSDALTAKGLRVVEDDRDMHALHVWRTSAVSLPLCRMTAVRMAGWGGYVQGRLGLC